MWRRTYLVLLLIRVYFALSPSYIHPDEHFQGLEVFAGKRFVYETWVATLLLAWLVLGHLTMRRRDYTHTQSSTSRCLRDCFSRSNSLFSIQITLGVYL